MLLRNKDLYIIVFTSINLYINFNIFSGDDGFLERFLFFASKPRGYKKAEKLEPQRQLATYVI